MEIERKFTVKKIPDNLDAYKYHDIEQVYVLTNPVIRARKRDDEFILTVKGSGMMARSEFELPLDEDAYNKLKQKAEGIVISKRRYLIPFGQYTIELDIFNDPVAPLVIAEVEFESIEAANSFIPPEWFDEDVTNNPKYHNSNISKGLF